MDPLGRMLAVLSLGLVAVGARPYVVELAPTTAEELLEHAVRECPTNRRPSRQLVAELLELEVRAGVPVEVRGLLAAAACAESGYRASPDGHNDGGSARGMLQFWPWAKRSIRRHGATTDDPRDDWRASARFWIAHVKRQLKRVSRHCRGRRGYASRTAARWSSANLTAVRAPKCGRRNSAGRCVKRVPRCARALRSGGETRHVRILRSWRGRL